MGPEPVTAPQRYPLEPLASALGITLGDVGQFHGNQHTDATDNDTITATQALAEHLGVDRRTIRRWRHEGIPADKIDHLACHIVGCNPINIWPEYDDQLDDIPPELFDPFHGDTAA